MENNIKELAIERAWISIKSQAIVETAIATGIAVVVPAIFAHTPNNQFIVGPIVNAVLFWVTLRFGLTNALFIAAAPSLIALFRGMLPPQAIVTIPFIIAGNCAMIFSFWYLTKRYSHLLSVLASALIKTLIIFMPVWLLLNLPPVVTFMMGWPQVVTAVIGGTIVILINRILSSKNNI